MVGEQEFKKKEAMIEKRTDLEGLFRIKIDYNDNEVSALQECLNLELASLGLNTKLTEIGRNKKSWVVNYDRETKKAVLKILFHGKSFEDLLLNYFSEEDGLDKDIGKLKKLAVCSKNPKVKNKQNPKQATNKPSSGSKEKSL